MFDKPVLKMLAMRVLFIIHIATSVSCTIAGLSYVDPLNSKTLSNKAPGQDICNPLYWFPRHIPDYCYFNQPKLSGTKPKPVPIPIPVPLPAQPFPMSAPPMFHSPLLLPIAPTYPMFPPPIAMSPLSAPMPSPPMALPFGLPLSPSNPMLPAAGVPYLPYPNIANPISFNRPMEQAGMVPGIPGMVTHDGGINILPFSDAYADMLEKHKQKVIRKKLQRVLDDYDGSNERWKHRRRHRYY